MTVYLDHAATTPMRPQAVAAMLPYLTEHFGNPSGAHALARQARAAIDDARDAVAAALGAQPGEIVFTGSGTEADNLAIHGRLRAAGPGRAVCSAVEHHAVLHPVESTNGTVVAVGGDGVIDLEQLAATLDDDVVVVSVMLVNNEVGTIQPLADVADAVRRHAPNALVHTDAVQAAPWLDIADVAAAADLVAVSAHKFGGPKGVGALVTRDRASLVPIIEGGGQERDRRSGTHNVAGIVGMAAALDATVAERAATVARVRRLRDRLTDELLRAVPNAIETGRRENKIAAACHLLFEGVESEALVLLLDDAGLAASAGSACASGALEPSHVLLAMGVDRSLARSGLRLSLGWSSTDDDVDLALKVVPEAVARLTK
ncbi:MAG TPA: cysteine desulfurase family protein [Acidimicrobiales bacterium]|nr:cysteine desulfurase family protein [Acidimicrobiales bacterium]